LLARLPAAPRGAAGVRQAILLGGINQTKNNTK